MNLDDITNRMKKFSRDTAEEVQKRTEIRQLNAQVNAEKKKIVSMYTEMGKKLYDLYKDEPMQEFESEFRSLAEAFKVIDKLQERIRSVKGVTLCPSCKKEVPVTERFCSNCGAKMPEIFRIEETGDPYGEAAADAKADETEADDTGAAPEAAAEEPEKEPAESAE